MGEEFVGILAFADDIVLIAENYEQSQEMLNQLELLLSRLRLELNVRKTQFMSNYEGNLTYQGNNLIRTDRYKYLGKIIEQELNHNAHIEN